MDTSQESVDQEGEKITNMKKIKDSKDPTTIKENLEEIFIIMENGTQEKNCWSKNKTGFGAILLDRSRNKRDEESIIEYLMSHVEIC